MPQANRYHGPLWRNIMQEIHSWDRFGPRGFVRPPAIITEVVCRDSGMLACDLCRQDPRGNRVRTEIFTLATVPTERCNVHQEHWVCVAHDHRYVGGPLAHADCEGAQMRVGLVRAVPIPEEYAHVAIRDRQHEHHPHVRLGLTCALCTPAAQNHANDAGMWDWDWWWNQLPGANNPPPDETPQPGVPDPDYDTTPQPSLPPGSLWG